mgnify:CR=1 FL=1
MRIQINTGGGLVVLGLCILGYRLMQRPNEAQAKPMVAQAEPPRQVVWMTHFNERVSNSGQAPSSTSTQLTSWLVRAWSDGTVELRRFEHNWVWSTPGAPSYSDDGQYSMPWTVIPDTQFGMACRTDVNHDGTIDGADLAELLGAWGPANCEPVTNIQCPLNLLSVAGS